MPTLSGYFRRSDEDVPLFERLLGHGNAWVRGGAAVGLFLVQKERISDGALGVLCDAMLLSRRAPEASYVWLGATVKTMATQALTLLGTRGCEAATGPLVAAAHGAAKPIPLADGTFDVSGFDHTMTLLRMWLPLHRGQLANLSELDAEQRRVIESMSDVDLQGDFSVFGLPQRAELRRKLLSGA